MKRWSVVVACASLLSVVLSTACSNEHDKGAGQSLGGATNSSIEAIPVPRQAVAATIPNTEGDFAAYRVASTTAVVSHWYDSEVAQGRDWRGWTRCRAATNDDPRVIRRCYRNDTLLAVIV